MGFFNRHALGPHLLGVVPALSHTASQGILIASKGIFCYDLGMENSPLDKAFQDQPKTEIGTKRDVWDIPGETEQGDIMLKERLSRQELAILKFLADLGISEELLSYDKHRLAIAKIHGGPPEAYFPKPGSLAEDENLSQFSSDYLAKLIFMSLQGIVHNDLKSVNMLVSDSDQRARFIDFGHSVIFGPAFNNFKPELRGEYNISQLSHGLDLIENLSPDLSSLKDNIWRRRAEASQFFEQHYEQSNNLSVSLYERPALTEKQLKKGDIMELLTSLGLPSAIAADVEIRVFELLAEAAKKYVEGQEAT